LICQKTDISIKIAPQEEKSLNEKTIKKAWKTKL
jgi:hypothetical protein